MRKILLLPALMMFVGNGAYADEAALDAAIANARANCSGISEKMEHLKQMAGISTAVNAVGTAAGGVALGTGIAKAKTDSEIERIRENLRAAKDKWLSGRSAKNISGTAVSAPADLASVISNIVSSAMGHAGAGRANSELATLDKKSQQLGNIRTGTLAATTATNLTGAIISGTNKADGDLGFMVGSCVGAVKALSNEHMQARIEGVDTAKLNQAQNIIAKCSEWELVDMTKFNKKGTGAAATGGIGAGLGLIGTITSGVANSNSVRSGESGNAKALNTTANVMAGGATAASAVATVLNATQIKDVKKAVSVADACEEALQ